MSLPDVLYGIQLFGRLRAFHTNLKWLVAAKSNVTDLFLRLAIMAHDQYLHSDCCSLRSLT